MMSAQGQFMCSSVNASNLEIYHDFLIADMAASYKKRAVNVENRVTVQFITDFVNETRR